jgi:hypothetical protein
MSDQLRLTPGGTVMIRGTMPEPLEVEGSWGPGGKPPPAHYHPAQDEHFETRPAGRTEQWFRSIRVGQPSRGPRTGEGVPAGRDLSSGC